MKERLVRDVMEQLENERHKLKRQPHHDKADLDKVDKLLDDLNSYKTMKRKRNAM